MKDRILELRRVRADELQADPRNWRLHDSTKQLRALQEMIERIGIIAPLIARETPEGLRLIDGHLRATLNPSAMVPVLVVDLSEAEAGEAILTYDPIGALARADEAAYMSLLQDSELDADVLAIKQSLELYGFDTEIPSLEPAGAKAAGSDDQAELHMCPNCGCAF